MPEKVWSKGKEGERGWLDFGENRVLYTAGILEYPEIRDVSYGKQFIDNPDVPCPSLHMHVCNWRGWLLSAVTDSAFATPRAEDPKLQPFSKILTLSIRVQCAASVRTCVVQW